MAIIHTTPRRSGTEALIKLLDTLTDEIVLIHGKILISQFSHNHCNSVKMSLFIEDNVYEHIGIRNVFLEDVSDTVEIRMADKQHTQMFLEVLRQTRDWNKAFPSENRAVYHLADLRQAAIAVRDYLLLGKLPSVEISEAMNNLINKAVPEKGFVEFDVLPTLTDYDF